MTESDPSPTQETPTRETTVAVTMPTEPKPQENRMKFGDFVPFITVALTISAAVFYIAGWVYEVYWYGFFGINLTQVSIPLQQIMIEGLPGIIIIAISSFIAIIIINVLINRKNANKKNSNLIRIIVVAYGICVLIVFVIGIIFRAFLNPLPNEIWISGFGLVLVFSVLILLQLFRRNRISLLLDATKDLSPLLVNVVLSSFIPGLGAINALLSAMGEDTLRKMIKNKKKEDPFQKEKIAIDIVNAWRIWIGLVILFFVLLSLTISAILGRTNAHYGQRLMMGGWEMNEIFIYSSKPDLPLPHSSTPYTEKGYTYGPFGIIANDDQVYYLAEWKVGNYYETRPNLYTLPRSNSTTLIILYAPQSTPTPLPTSTPTSMSLFTPTTLQKASTLTP